MSSIKLIWVTPDAEAMIVDMARVSAPENQGKSETAPKLLSYLLKHKHISPFEMADMCVEINTTRAIAPQILRHRSFSFQEFSQRYSDSSKLGNSEVPHLRRQDYKNRQNSIDDLDADTVAKYYRRIIQLFEDSEHLYKEMTSNGVAKECARAVLPLATPTRLYMKGSLRSWITYIALREKNGTQLEHMKIAKDIKTIFCGQFPIIAEALGGNDPWEI
jgi:thymidylate synthase (FAD)